MKFDPYTLSQNSYQSAAVELSKNYFDHICMHVDYLFEKNKSSWQGKTK
jgi:hypothetical protein